MEINSLLPSIDIPTTDEQLLKEFLAQKESHIINAILQIWEKRDHDVKVEGESCCELEQKEDVVETLCLLPEQESTSINPSESAGIESVDSSAEGNSVVATEPETLQTERPNMNKLGQENISEEAKEKAKNDALEFQLKSKNIILPNGKVGQAYSVPFDVAGLNIPELADVSFEDLEVVGLTYSPEEKLLKGVPLQSGDYKITLKCRRKDWEEGKPVFERQLTLIINPDPRSLWNNIPTDETIEYFKPDEEKLFVAVESKSKKPLLLSSKRRRKDMVAASQRGRSHAHEGKPRDDDFALHHDEATDWYIMVVADGAGSAKYSRKGSQIACQTVCEFCKVQIPLLQAEFENAITAFQKENSQPNRKLIGDKLYHIIGGAAFKAYKNIEEEATKNNYPLKDFSTTLLVSICKKFSFGWFVGSFWVGDGGIGIYAKEPQFLKVMGEVDSGEFAGQTRFLTMPEIMQPTEIYRRLRFEIVPDFTALILMTDGITDPKFETDNNLMRIEKWNDLWEDLSKEVIFSDDNHEADTQLLKWLDFWSTGNHDDRTIAILF